jgi:RNA polymerase sigma-70 factor (ECF subfamily)
MSTQATALAPAPAENDAVLAARIGRGDQAAFEALMRRYNGRLFRVARAILRDDAEAEDALQEAYLDAYRHMAEFRGGSALSTWLTRIVVNRSLMRLRRRKRERIVVPFDHNRGEADLGGRDVDPPDNDAESPAGTTLRAEIRAILERRIDELPLAFRTVFVMREVDDMTVEQTAECLDIPPATVRTRLFRARSLLRQSLASDIENATAGVFGFAGERCDRIVSRVLAQLASD